MRNLKKWQLLIMLFVNAITFNTCSNSNAENKQVSAGNPVIQTKEETSELPTQNGILKVQTELNQAKKAGKAAFIVVTGTGSADIDKASEIAKGANTIYKNAVIVHMNRDDKANAQLVSQWRLAGAPLPLILVISPKGLPTGGYILSQATAEKIAALIPSPKLEDVYAAIGNGTPSIVVFTKKTMNDRAEVLQACKDAVSKLNNNAVIVEVDMEDSKEKNFMNQLRIYKSSKASITLVINSQGQVSGTSTTVPDAAKLASAATQTVKGGCGPGCGPAGCEK